MEFLSQKNLKRGKKLKGEVGFLANESEKWHIILLNQIVILLLSKCELTYKNLYKHLNFLK